MYTYRAKVKQLKAELAELLEEDANDDKASVNNQASLNNTL
jgi:hypothetical protein